MDKEQIEKKLDWLDEQRQKDQENIQRVKTQIIEVQSSIGNLAKQIEAISTDLSRLAANASRISQFDDALSKHRSEISKQLENAEERRTKKEKQLEALRLSDQKKLVKSIDELERELNRLDGIDEKLEVRRAEDVRLNQELIEVSEEIGEVGARIENQSLRLVSLDETTAQESKRVGELQNELASRKRKTEQFQNALDAIEDRARKVEVAISELRSSDKERSDQLEVWTDEQRMKLVDFDKKWSDWEKRFDAFEKESQEIEEKIRAYDQTHRGIKQTQMQLEGLIERLERRITEVGEMQRLSQERMKQDWAAFEADETKKWSTFKLSSDERWKEHERVHDKLSASLENLEELRVHLREDLDLLVEREARKVNEIVALTRQWLQDRE